MSDRHPPLRIGLLGCGRIVQLVHLEILAGMRWSALVAVAEPDPQALEIARARVPGVAGHEDWRELVQRGDLDAVVVALPSALHAEAAVTAFDAGLSVYVEKPLATTLPDAERAAEAWRRAGTVGMTGFAFRYSEPYRRLRTTLRQGEAGSLSSMRVTFCSAPRELAGWKRSRATGGGALLDLASHAVDTVRFVTGGEVASVQALISSARSEDDTALLTLDVVGGAAGDGLPVQVMVSASAAQADRVEVLSDRGGLVADRMAQTLTRVPLAPAATRPERMRNGVAELLRAPWEVRSRVLPAPEPSFAVALRAFRTCALRGWPATPDLDDGVRCLRVLLAAEESAASGRRVELRVEPARAPSAWTTATR